MTFELLPGTMNVMRFPLGERARPSLDLLHEIKPDSREVSLIIDTCGYDQDLYLIRETADRAMAEHILNHVRPEPGPERRRALEDLLKPLVAVAVDASRQARRAVAAATAAERRLAVAQAAGGHWIAPLEEEVFQKCGLAAQRLVEAYAAAEEAEGAARAVDLAKRNEVWRPFDLEAEAMALFAGIGTP